MKAARQLDGVVGQRCRRQVVGGSVGEIAGAVLRRDDDRGAVDEGGHVVVSADEQSLDGAPLVGLAIAVKAIVVEHRPLDDRGNDRVVDVVRHLPAQRGGAELAGASVSDRGRLTHPLGVELRARPQSDEDEPALFVVGHGQAPKGRRPLAGVQQRRELATGEIVGDALVLDHPDRHRVGIGVRGAGRRGFDSHRRNLADPGARPACDQPQ